MTVTKVVGSTAVGATAVGQIGSDPEVLEAFYREHIEAVQRFIARRVAVPQDAADLTTEVFLAAIDSCQRYRSQAGAPIAWLYGIARNLIAMHYRSAGRAARAATRLETSGWVNPDAADRIAARIDAESPGRRLIGAMADLPERQRAVLERALEEHGIQADITYLPDLKTCAPGRYRAVDRPTGGLSEVGSSYLKIELPPDSVRPGETFVLTWSVEPYGNDGFRSSFRSDVATGSVGPCVPVPWYDDER